MYLSNPFRDLFSLCLLLPQLTFANSAPSTPTVTSPAGTIEGRTGHLDPSVHEYLGIPYSNPPIGPRRFNPPTRLPRQTSPIIAKDFGLSCISQPIQELSDSPLNITIGPEGEDCLSVNVWTKSGRTNAPVLVWLYGGAFVWGSSKTPMYDGTHFVANHDVVVVSVNYRGSVFGFPNSPAVPVENLGILDQRLALEWVRDNIKSFGGNPSRITLFGQSAGGASVDIHSFAWPKDPIVKGLIPQSGTVGILPILEGTGSYYRWGNLTEKVGCFQGNEEQKLECMRGVTWEKLVEGMKELQTCGNSTLMAFGPRVDGKVIFSQEGYRQRGEKGLFAKLPLLIGTTNAEAPTGAGLLPGCPAAYEEGLTPEQIAQVLAARVFHCPARKSAGYRLLHKVPTWRYRYFGSFNLNSTIGLDLGASHGSEVPVVFGTALELGNLAQREREVIKYIQSMWIAFAKNPSSGLSASPLSLPQYREDTRKPSLIRLAYGEEIEASLTWPEEYDYICDNYGLN